MRKSRSSRLLHRLSLFTLAMATTSAGAATLYGTGYARVGVPDLAQAVTFFQDVLDCRVIGPDAASTKAGTNKPANSRLLSCDADSIVELVDNRGTAPAPVKPGQPLQFITDDVRHGGEWLRREGATVNGSPHRLTSGPLSGRMVLDVASPWGMPLQLLDSRTSPPADGALATVAGD